MVVSGVVLAAGGLSVFVIGALGWSGRLPRNRWNGIRTGATTANEATWNAAHRAAGPALTAAGAAWIGAGAVLAVTEGALWLVPFVAGAAVAVTGAMLGHRTALRLLRDRR